MAEEHAFANLPPTNQPAPWQLETVPSETHKHPASAYHAGERAAGRSARPTKGRAGWRRRGRQVERLRRRSAETERRHMHSESAWRVREKLGSYATTPQPQTGVTASPTLDCRTFLEEPIRLAASAENEPTNREEHEQAMSSILTHLSSSIAQRNIALEDRASAHGRQATIADAEECVEFQVVVPHVV